MLISDTSVVQISASAISGEPDFLPTTAGSLCRSPQNSLKMPEMDKKRPARSRSGFHMESQAYFSQPRRRKYQNGVIAEATIKTSANG